MYLRPRSLLNATNSGQVPACSQEPVDSTDANMVETSTCLETTQQEMSPSDIDRIGLVHVQLRPWVFKAATATKIYCELGRSWGIVSMLKSLQKQLQRRHNNSVWKYIHFSEYWCFSDGHFIASSANRKQCAGVIFGTPGTTYFSYSLVVSPSVYAVFPPRLSVRIYLSSDDC